jgi:RNA polymerase sigma factor (sigma-70 family)
MNPHATIEDAELLKLFFRTRNEGHLRVLMDRHLPLVYSAALRVSDSPELAAEAAQDVFLKLTRSNELLMTRGIPFIAWLHRSARHRALDLLRSERARRQRERIAVELAALPAGESLSAGALGMLDEVIGELPVRDRMLVLERFFSGRTLASLAVPLGLTEDAVRMRLNRALEKMRALFAARGIATTTALLAGALPLQAIVPPPASLALGVKVKVLAESSAAAGSSAWVAALLGWVAGIPRPVVVAGLLGVAGIAGGIYHLMAEPAPGLANAGSSGSLPASARSSPASVAALRPVSLHEEKQRLDLIRQWLMDTSPEDRDSDRRLMMAVNQLSVAGTRELLADRELLKDVQGPEREDEFPNPIYPRRETAEHLLWMHYAKLAPQEAIDFMVATDLPAHGILVNAAPVIEGVAKVDPQRVIDLIKNPPGELPQSLGLGGCFEIVLPMLVKHSKEQAYDLIHHLEPMSQKDWYLSYVGSLGPDTDWPAERARLDRDFPVYSEIGFRLEGVYGNMAGLWACTDPDAAFAWIATAEKDAWEGYFEATFIWLQRDPADALRWLKTWNPPGIDKSTVFAKVLVFGGADEIRYVDGLLEMIPDPAMRTETIRKVMENMGKGMERESLEHLKSSPLLDQEAKAVIDEMIAGKAW